MVKAVIFDKNGLFSQGDYVEEMKELALQLKAHGLKLFLLSNGDGEYQAEWQQYFTKQYYSGLTGFNKPHARAYQQILEENNLKAEECIFFDDTQSNVDGAKAVGMQAYLFQNPEQVKELI